MSRISYGGKLKKDVARSGAMCVHTVSYALVDATGKQVGNWGWMVDGQHSAGRECLFTDIALLQRLATQMEMAGIEIYRMSEPDEKAAADVARGGVKTLDEVIKGT